eukprot:SAG22_NODE_381_length_11354_cov_6.529631_3_plen_378_part_00
MQIVSGLAESLNIKFPQGFTDFVMSLASLVRFDLSEVLSLGDMGMDISIGCMSSGHYYSKLQFNILLVCFVVMLEAVHTGYQVQQVKSGQKHMSEDEHRARVLAIFSQFDKDGDGVELEEVTQIARKIDPEVSDEAVEHLFELADTDKSGVIDFEEFYAAVMKKNRGLSKRAKAKAAESNADETIVAWKEAKAAVSAAVSPEEKEAAKAKAADAKVAADAARQAAKEAHRAKNHPAKHRFDLKVLVKRQQMLQIRADASGRLFLLVFLLYPGLTGKIFQGTACRQLGPGSSVLLADYSVSCEDVSYLVFKWFIVPGLIVAWPFGLPMLLFAKMYKVRKELVAEDEDTVKQYDFVCGDYKPTHWYGVENLLREQRFTF